MSRAVRVTVNDRPLIGRRTGVGRYLERVAMHWPDDADAPALRGLCGAIERLEPPAPPPPIESVGRLDLRPLASARPPAESAGLKRAVLRAGFRIAAGARQRLSARSTDVFFEPNHVPLAPTRPMVTTIHDLSVLEVPQHHPPDRVRAWAGRFERGLAETDRFVCVSEATAAALVRLCSVAPDRVTPIHLGPTWPGRPEGWTPESCRAAMGLPDDAVVHLGTIEPRKNIGVLLEAVRIRREKGLPGRVVLLGGLGWGAAGFWGDLLGHPAAGDVLWADAPGDAQVLAALIGARGLVCPSHYEGFGLPPLEAMALGRRAVVSTAASLVEVTGDAAPHLDPADAPAWAEAVGGLLDSDEAGDRAAAARAEEFSWVRTAREHARVFAEAAAG